MLDPPGVPSPMLALDASDTDTPGEVAQVLRARPVGADAIAEHPIARRSANENAAEIVAGDYVALPGCGAPDDVVFALVDGHAEAVVAHVVVRG